jgi:hypothetical protein
MSFCVTACFLDCDTLCLQLFLLLLDQTGINDAVMPVEQGLYLVSYATQKRGEQYKPDQCDNEYVPMR